jgi:hypothetical protein
LLHIQYVGSLGSISNSATDGSSIVILSSSTISFSSLRVKNVAEYFFKTTARGGLTFFGAGDWLDGPGLFETRRGVAIDGGDSIGAGLRGLVAGDASR